MKMQILTAAVLTGISSVAMSQVPPAPLTPPAAPAIYANGPQSPLVASTDLSLAERTAYANYEAIMQIAEARIHATSCADSAGEFPVTAFSDGSVGNPGQNFATVLSNGSSFTVETTSVAPDTQDKRGQMMKVVLDGDAGKLKGRDVRLYAGDFAYNGVNNMMDGTSTVEVRGINNRYDKYYGKVIKDFYRGSLDSTSNDYYNIFDWGLQSLDKLGYPVNKYWQASISHRDDGTIGRTVFVKDRLVGATSCRIIIDTQGNNNQDYFSQEGHLKIQTNVNPGAPVSEFGEYPFVF